MKTTTFYIGINIKTADGFESIGRFYVGNDSTLAREIFKKLKGDEEVSETSMITFELMETANGLPVNLQLVACTLQELADNCAVITKEVFKGRNLTELI